MKTNERIIEMREELDLSKKFMAEFLKIPLSSYKELEEGERHLKNKELERLSKAFGVSKDYILNGGDNDIEDFKRRIINKIKEREGRDKWYKLYRYTVNEYQDKEMEILFTLESVI